ncbi:MAG: hypothetical protein WAN51_07645 [Alphaproteobacteria bacterium]
MTAATGKVGAIVQESGTTGETLATATKQLSASADALRQEVMKFLATVRAA